MNIVERLRDWAATEEHGGRGLAAEMFEDAADEIERRVPKSWDGLMSILDEVYPEDVFPTAPRRQRSTRLRAAHRVPAPSNQPHPSDVVTVPDWLLSAEPAWFDFIAAPIAIAWFVTALAIFTPRRGGREPAPISRWQLHHINQRIDETEGER